MKLDDNSAYLGNPLLKRANVAVEWTEETISEYQRCMEDPLYFVENYIKIVSLDEGVVPFKLFPFQKDIVGTIHNNRFTICKLPRQSGKTTTLVANRRTRDQNGWSEAESCHDRFPCQTRRLGHYLVHGPICGLTNSVVMYSAAGARRRCGFESHSFYDRTAVEFYDFICVDNQVLCKALLVSRS